MVPNYVKNVIKTLKEAGFQSYVVGGAVRDILRGEEPADFDVATSARPEEVSELFEKVIPTGLLHGTVTVLTEGGPVEITTFRSEKGYSDSRHPDSVSFGVSVGEDVLRRDFTVNALCMDEEGVITDLVNGEKDIEAKLIRTVGNADERFREDALRILRALRFSAVLGFTVEEKTAEAIMRNRELLKNISAERIGKELFLLICGDEAAEVLERFYILFKELIPEIKRENIKLMSCVLPLVEYRAHILMGDEAPYALKRLKTKNETIRRVQRLCRVEKIGDSAEELKIFASYEGKEEAEFILKYYSDKTGKIQIYEKWQRIKDEVVYSEDLAIKGNEIADIGFSGREISEMKDSLLTAVNKGELKNTRTALSEYLKNKKG